MEMSDLRKEIKAMREEIRMEREEIRMERERNIALSNELQAQKDLVLLAQFFTGVRHELFDKLEPHLQSVLPEVTYEEFVKNIPFRGVRAPKTPIPDDLLQHGLTSLGIPSTFSLSEFKLLGFIVAGRNNMCHYLADPSSVSASIDRIKEGSSRFDVYKPGCKHGLRVLLDWWMATHTP